MALAQRLMATMTGLVVLTAAIVGSLAYPHVERPELLLALAALAVILTPAAALAHGLAAEWLDKPVDLDRLAQMLDQIGVRETGRRPEILHVDDDHDVLDLVAQALNSTANVTSADSLAEARRALALHRFDLAVLDVELGGVSGLDLLPDLRGSRGRAIPVIIFSAHGANPVRDPQVQASLSRSPAALESLVATVHDRLTPRSSLAS